MPTYTPITPSSPISITIDSSVLPVRPFVVAGVLRNVTFTETSFQSFIQLQDKLHQNICRMRKYASVGTHDLDTLSPPFVYKADSPRKLSFKPLNQGKAMNGVEIMKNYEDSHLRDYLPLIREKEVYPIIYDSKSVVLSLPPIINGDHSKMSAKTKNVFIEVTGLDETKANIVLNTLVTAFSRYCEKPFTVEKVKVVDGKGGSEQLTPDLSPKQVETNVKYVNEAIGISLSANEMKDHLARMCLPAKVEGERIVVDVPPTRSDVIHGCDVMEDVAIAYGFNNLKKTIPKTITAGKIRPINKLQDALRDEVARAGFFEVLTLSLTSKEENHGKLRRQEDGKSVLISNPKTSEFEAARRSLFPGLFKTLTHNRDKAVPFNIFEISDVVETCEEETDTGAKNKRVLGAVHANVTAGFEEIHGLMDYVMARLEVGFRERENKEEVYTNGEYWLEESKDEIFLEGMRCDIMWEGKKVGVMGVVHPEVMKNFGLTYPMSALEMEIEHFV